jgi:hypothetical protein
MKVQGFGPKTMLLLALVLSGVAHGAQGSSAAATPVEAIPADTAQLRELVDGSLEVYPIKGYGAIEIGAHRFCHTEDGKLDCGTFRFLQVWRFKDGAWKVSRDVSFGH